MSEVEQIFMCLLTICTSSAGLPIFGESQSGVEETEAKMQREGEMRDRESILVVFEPLFYTFLRRSKVGFYEIRPWVGVQDLGYLLGNNSHGKTGRKQGG